MNDKQAQKTAIELVEARNRLVRRAKVIFQGYRARCTCGWNNSDHAPECPVEGAWLDAMDEAREEEA